MRAERRAGDSSRPAARTAGPASSSPRARCGWPSAASQPHHLLLLHLPRVRRGGPQARRGADRGAAHRRRRADPAPALHGLISASGPPRPLGSAPCSGRCSRSPWVSWVSPCSACSPSGSSWRRSAWAGRWRDSARRINRAAEDLERAAVSAAAGPWRGREPLSAAVMRFGHFACHGGSAGTLLVAARQRGAGREREYARGLPGVYP